MNCGGCGHALTLHGRRGHGHCRHGHVDRLALAVDVVKAAVVAGVEPGPLVDAALAAPDERCTCKRFVKTRVGRVVRPPPPPPALSCTCGHAVEEHGRDPDYPGSSACVECDCVAFEGNDMEES